MFPQGDQNESKNEGRGSKKVNDKVECLGDKGKREREEELLRQKMQGSREFL